MYPPPSSTPAGPYPPQAGPAYPQPPSGHNPYPPPSGPPPGYSPYPQPPGGVPHNPYLAPNAGAPQWGAAMQQQPQLPLAGRGTRFLGAVLDMLIYVLAMVPASFDTSPPGESGVLGSIAAVLLLMTVAVQWYLISTTGQSIAKKLLKMKIVKVDGQDVNFVSGVVMRSWVPGFISAIPLVGMLFWLIDPLVIFGEERRCVHDVMAGTKVISV